MFSLLDPRVWLACAGLAVGGFAAGYAKRWAGESERFEARDRVRISAEATSRAKDLDAAYSLAAEYEAQRHDLEARYTDARTALDKALQRPAKCPVGPVGDLVLDADVVRSLRDAGTAGAAPGPAASQPGRGL